MLPLSNCFFSHWTIPLKWNFYTRGRIQIQQLELLWIYADTDPQLRRKLANPHFNMDLWIYSQNQLVVIRVADPHHSNADLDNLFSLMRIRIRIYILLRILILLLNKV
jgi:hypothetical protein